MKWFKLIAVWGYLYPGLFTAFCWLVFLCVQNYLTGRPWDLYFAGYAFVTAFMMGMAWPVGLGLLILILLDSF